MNNPQAFPILKDQGTSESGCLILDTEEKGMTLLDYFAGQGLIGILHMDQSCSLGELSDGSRGGMHEAKASYVLAEAMLKEREKYGSL